MKTGLVWDPFDEMWLRESAMEMLTLLRAAVLYLDIELYLAGVR
jgi:hypothetical protein